MRPQLLLPLLALSACAEVPIPAPPVEIPDVLPELLPEVEAQFASTWADQADRIWIGPEYWANRTQDWRIQDGRIECISNRLGWRTLHRLDHGVDPNEGELELRLRLGLKGKVGEQGGFGGVLLGAGAADLDPRAAALVQSAPGPEGGILAGIDGEGHLVLSDFWQAGGGALLARQTSPAPLPSVQEVELRVLIADSVAQDGASSITLEAYLPGQLSMEFVAEEEGLVVREPLASLTVEAIDSEALIGNLAIVADQRVPNKAEEKPNFWFADWRAKGFGLRARDDMSFGPIFGAQHTLSRGVLKMTAQLPPLTEVASAESVRLELFREGFWEQVETSPVLTPGWTAHFRIEDWDDTQDEQYRLVFPWRGEDWKYTGTIRRDPVDREEIVLAALSCNHNNKHGFGRAGYAFSNDTLWFPHVELTDKLGRQDPDLLFFAGDQIYEGASPTFPDRAQGMLDYSYKWSLWYWAFGDLARDRPCITIPDDHDVYQGNLWGQSGRAAKRDNEGGYTMPAEFVQMVERTQTWHLPDPWSDAVLEQGITSYYTDLLYGRVSFAVLEDRKFKTGPAGLIEHDGPRPDHITDPAFEPASADVEGAQLLGEEQLRFLDHWAADWAGADFKATLSASVFAGLATHHGPRQDYLRIDLDSNGWPQTGRNKALAAIRRGFGVMIGGDQHLSTIAHHGIDEWEDAGFSFVVPAIANFYARSWRPKGPPIIPLDDLTIPHTGSYMDGLGNRVTVYAHTNPSESGHQPAALHDQMPGWGTIRFRKLNRTVVFECWPRWADPISGPQYQGWPFEVPQLLNGGRRAGAHLPELRVSGMRDPVLQVIDSFSNEVIYTLRISGQRFRPPVPEEGKYDLRIGELGTDREILVAGVRATIGNDRELIVDI